MSYWKQQKQKLKEKSFEIGSLKSLRKCIETIHFCDLIEFIWIGKIQIFFQAVISWRSLNENQQSTSNEPLSSSKLTSLNKLTTSFHVNFISK